MDIFEMKFPKVFPLLASEAIYGVFLDKLASSTC